MIFKINRLLSEEGIAELKLWCDPSNVTVVTNDINGEEPYIKSDDLIINETKLTLEVQLKQQLKKLISEYVREIDEQLFRFHSQSERGLYTDYVLKTTNLYLTKWSALPSFRTYPLIKDYLKELKSEVETRLIPLTKTTDSTSSVSEAAEKNSLVFTFKYYYDTHKTNKFINELLKTGWIARRPFDKPHEDISQVRKDLKKVFIGKSINRPVVWTGPKNQLYYLITQLYKRELLLNTNKENYWDMTINSFIKTNGTMYKKRELQVTNPPKADTEVIDRLLDSL